MTGRRKNKQQLVIKHRLMSEAEDWPAGVPDPVKTLCRRQIQYFHVEDNILYGYVLHHALINAGGDAGRARTRGGLARLALNRAGR